LLDEAAAGDGLLPSSSEEAATIGVGAASSPSGAALSQPGARGRPERPEDDPRPTSTGSALEAEDRALLRAEDDRLRRLAVAYYRETARAKSLHPVAHEFRWIPSGIIAWHMPLDYEELEWQVEEEFAALERKQRQEKAD
jgi:hypothetical protein